MRKKNNICLFVIFTCVISVLQFSAQEAVDLSSENYLKRALERSYAAKNWSEVQKLELAYFKLDSAKGNFSGALAHFKDQAEAADSINIGKRAKKQAAFEMQLLLNKKQAADSIRVMNEKLVAAAELKSEKSKKFGLFGGIGLVFLFAGFMYNRFRVTQKQKKIIEEQKKLVEYQKTAVEEKQHEILDSIRYARRIQTAMMSSERYVEGALKKLRR